MSAHDSELDRWEQAAHDFTALYPQIPAERRVKSIDGGWSARQVLHHLLEDETHFSTRLRAAIVEPGSTILPFDAARYQANLSYTLVPDEPLLAGLFALRSINGGLPRALPDESWEQTAAHPEAGDQSVEQISLMFGDHIADHLNDLQIVALERAAR